MKKKICKGCRTSKEATMRKKIRRTGRKRDDSKKNKKAEESKGDEGRCGEVGACDGNGRKKLEVAEDRRQKNK